MVEIRTTRGGPVRNLTLDPTRQSTHVRRTALGPRARLLVYDALVDERDGDIWLLRLRLRHVTSGRGEDHSPTLSPDRRLIAFVRSGYYVRDDEGALLAVPAAGGRARPLLPNLRGRRPAWGPDGKRVVYQHKGAIYVASLGTRRTRRLTSGRDPTWSPDGRSIAFARGAGESAPSIRTSRPDGTGEKLVATLRVPAFHLAWSPDARALAYSTGSAISVLALGGTPRALVTEMDNPLYSPTWSPDGRTIAYAAGWDNDIPYPWDAPDAHFLEIWTVDVRTGARKPLIQSAGFNYAPSWR